jgi:hypothetical protein
MGWQPNPKSHRQYVLVVVSFNVSWRSAMAKLNSNSVLCNLSVNDNVVAARMGIGSQRGSWQTTASLPPGLPAPTFALREASALVESDYRDARRERAGRSEISPNAGGTVLPHRCPGECRTAIDKRWHFAKQQGFMKSQMLLANATRATRDRK